MKRTKKNNKREYCKIYIGNDPNFKGQKCKILSQTKDIAYVVFSEDDLLGTVKVNVNINQLI